MATIIIAVKRIIAWSMLDGEVVGVIVGNIDGIVDGICARTMLALELANWLSPEIRNAKAKQKTVAKIRNRFFSTV